MCIRDRWTALAAGFVLFFLNWWILALPLPVEAVTGLYILTIGTGYVCLDVYKRQLEAP